MVEEKYSCQASVAEEKKSLELFLVLSRIKEKLSDMLEFLPFNIERHNL